MTEKFCNKCSKIKPIDHFYKNKNRILTPCIECKLLYSKNRNIIIKNDKTIKEKVAQYKKKYYLNNKEQLLKNQALYYLDNKLYYQNYQKEYSKSHPRKFRAKSKKSIKDKIRSNISRSISKKINKSGNIKNTSIIKYLDFSFQELKDYLETLFEPWMNWNNYGRYNPDTWNDHDQSTWTWQIDHIVPHSYFNYSSMDSNQFKDCWKLTNLRPYSAKLNILEGNRRDIKNN